MLARQTLGQLLPSERRVPVASIEREDFGSRERERASHGLDVDGRPLPRTRTDAAIGVDVRNPHTAPTGAATSSNQERNDCALRRPSNTS